MNNDNFIGFSGSLTAIGLNSDPDAIFATDILRIRMTRDESRVVDEVHKQFGRFKRVVIDVDGEQHEFDADSFIQLLTSFTTCCSNG